MQTFFTKVSKNPVESHENTSRHRSEWCELVRTFLSGALCRLDEYETDAGGIRVVLEAADCSVDLESTAVASLIDSKGEGG